MRLARSAPIAVCEIGPRIGLSFSLSVPLHVTAYGRLNDPSAARRDRMTSEKFILYHLPSRMRPKSPLMHGGFVVTWNSRHSHTQT
jgi:hypothetical protein